MGSRVRPIPSGSLGARDPPGFALTRDCKRKPAPISACETLTTAPWESPPFLFRNSYLEIAEPGVVAALLQAGKPAAQRIKRKHNTSPHQVDNRQGVSPFGRLSNGELPEARRLEHPMRLPVARVTHGDRNQVY